MGFIACNGIITSEPFIIFHRLFWLACDYRKISFFFSSVFPWHCRGAVKVAYSVCCVPVFIGYSEHQKHSVQVTARRSWSQSFCIDLERRTKLGRYISRCVADPCFGPFCFCRCFLQSSDLGFTFMQNFTRHKCKILRVLSYFLFEQQIYITLTKCDLPSKNWMLFEFIIVMKKYVQRANLEKRISILIT